MISIYLENVIFSENEVNVETFKSSKLLFKWFNNKTTRRYHDWFVIEILKVINERLF